MELNEKIKILRAEHNLTLEELANAIGVSPSTILRYESGEIKNLRRDKIKKLADALHTTPAYLMGWEDISIIKNSNSLNISVVTTDEEKEIETLRPFFEGAGFNLSSKIEFDQKGKVKNITFLIQNEEYFYTYDYKDLKALKDSLISYTKFQINEIIPKAIEIRKK